MAMEIDPVWPTPQDCRHRHQGDFFQPTQPRYLMQLTPRSEAGGSYGDGDHLRTRLLYLDVIFWQYNSGLKPAKISSDPL
jgi:hypothetical protein